MNVSNILKSLTPREFDAGHAFSGRPTGTKVTGDVRAGETALKNSVCRIVLAESERFRMGRDISLILPWLGSRGKVPQDGIPVRIGKNFLLHCRHMFPATGSLDFCL